MVVKCKVRDCLQYLNKGVYKIKETTLDTI